MSLVEGLDEEIGDEDGFGEVGLPIAGEEEHLAGESGDAFDALGEGGGEGGLEFGILEGKFEELLVGGEGDEGVADFVGEVPRHLADEAEFVRLDFELHSALVLGDVIENEECGVGSLVCAEAEGDDPDADNRSRQMRRGPFEGSRGLAGLDDLEYLAAELLGEFCLRGRGLRARQRWCERSRGQCRRQRIRFRGRR